ncbi:uncharacterized protein EI97DRAFT_388732 [Westerdykella ornata]|uniref:Rho-GAP domain-containing protein n=1 Tax=Westerdykella ornata TaxID=318751 RepID=A0A6A6JVR5_WESOR|nr:uncharacterized protein EI97DRAFT_388732 [Westerdykella ornata]KAF2280701.1 hypothetical protein EI97DRAFT_388732 [Westerdykella ornata]
MPKSSSLSLAMRPKGGKETDAAPISPRSPGSPRLDYRDAEIGSPMSPYNNNVPQSPASPRVRKESKGIFGNFGATKSSTRIASPENSIRPVRDQEKAHTPYTNGSRSGSTPDLGRPVQTPNSEGTETRGLAWGIALTRADNRSEIAEVDRPTNSGSGKSTETRDFSSVESGSKRGQKLKKQGGLPRSNSIKIEDDSKSKAKLKANPPKISPDPSATWSGYGEGAPLRTAPLEKGQSWRQNISFGKLRTHSADRHDGSHHTHRDDDASSRKEKAEQSSLASGSYNESRGATLMSSLGSGARKMGEKMDSARKGMFGKLGRSSSTHDRDLQIPKEPYQFKIIHLGLVEQTRLTRISSRLENSKDKTEFWMPALPWRCIDYLNMKGTEEEGLYRVPGAAHTIKYYEQKFDQDRDVDLIADENLNDPNVIGSLFKNWLRQLPDEIFPKAIQAKIQQECQGAKSAPQMLKDELSKLPPFNYYLLFAITCHISLLHSCSELNKMNYNNLCICFQPAIKIDAFCFQFLILDWRNCWQGCWTEKEYLAEELKYLEAQEAQAAIANGQAPQAPGKPKGSQASAGHVGEGSKATSWRSDSADRIKHSRRGTSADAAAASSGRAAATNASMYASDMSAMSRSGAATEPDRSADRALSSADGREPFHVQATPHRGPASVHTESLAEEDDSGATPTQAQHARGPSETQFRLDLSNPPTSPFSLKF